MSPDCTISARHFSSVSEFCGFRESAHLWCLRNPGAYLDASRAVPAWARNQLRATDPAPDVEALARGASGDAYWDDWLREPEQRRNRHVVRPVVCRTFHVKSTRGTSGGQYSHFLSDIVLSQSAETVFDVDDVRSSAAADARLFAKLEAAPRVDLGEVLAGSARGTVRVEYDGSFASYAALARRLQAAEVVPTAAAVEVVPVVARAGLQVAPPRRR